MASEKRLIDANDLSRRENEVYMAARQSVPFFEIVHSTIQKLIQNAPTVDAVEVVRCKNCRWSRKIDHREPTDTPRPLICQCFKHHHIPAPWGARLAVEPDDFCSYGERRTNADS